MSNTVTSGYKLEKRPCYRRNAVPLRSTVCTRVSEPEPSLWPGSGSTLNICLIIYENYMELNIIDVFSQVNIKYDLHVLVRTGILDNS